MKKSSTILFCLFLALTNLFAQKATYVAGDATYKMAFTTFQLCGAGKTNKGEYYATIVSGGLFKGAKLTCLSFDKNLQTTNENEMELSRILPNRSGVGMQESFYLNDSLYSLITETDDKAKTQNLYLCTSYQNKMIFSKPRVLAKIKDINFKAKGVSEMEFFYHNFHTALSPDSSKILVTYIYQKTAVKQQFLFSQVWSAGFETLLWEKEEPLTFDIKTIGINSLYLDNQANAYFLFQDDEYRRYHYEIVRIREMGGKVDVHKLTSDNPIMKDLKIGFDANGDMLACGYYYDKRNFQGVAMLRFPVDMEKLPPLTFHNFRQEIDAKKLKESKYSELISSLILVGPEDEGYRLNEMINEPNGDITLVGELQYQNPTPDNKYFVYHYDDIVIIRINSVGKVLWLERIPKRHETRDRFASYCSYSCVRMGENIGIIYNDHIDNVWETMKTVKKFPSITSKNVLILAEVTPQGKITRNVAGDFQEKNYYPLANYVKQIAPNEGIIGFYRSSLFGLGKVTWK